ncbi:long-chain-fatty-acid--CoA ligase [Sporosarcina sp. ACRSL]|uniref:long-chain-fatty-acid--CoA ligase n=1 Tax=Sporosarcina sp. ACRSL TaxID=2918215 RepID=UPI001EF3E108|nr:long-chain-fatty-acid--CoA ligase [Sporosarcina sp. ACRSL]MCG7346257.1 long-chain-fatty-acid--CoA ligase [Sporosarcina sp. ACRSL]
MKGISGWIEKRAMITPKRVALIDEQQSLTYLEMNERIENAASIMHSVCSIQKGDRIGILAANSIDYIITLFAAAKLNAIVVPLNIRLTADELAYQIADSGLRTLIVDDVNYDRAIELNGRIPMCLLTFDSLQQTAPPLAGINEPDPAAPYIICYTSGTTGRPKGAVLTQEHMFWNAVNNSLSLDITSKDNIITLLPLFHIGGIGLFTFPVLMAGGTVVVPNRFDPDQALQIIETHRITIVMGVPAIHDAIRKSAKFADTDFSSVRFFYNGGAPCPEELIRFYFQKGIRFGQGYGLTETSPTVFLLSEEDFERKIGSIGQPVMFTDIRIVDEEGKDVRRGDIGELIVKGPNVIREYWNLPEATAQSFRDGWFATGDMVTQDDEGFVFIAGRKKEMIISGGENIYPLEIERVLHEMEEVDEAAVIGIPHERWGETPIAFVVMKSGSTHTEEQLRSHCADKLARYKIPSQFIFVSALPRNATGKIDKAALRKSYSEEVKS